MTVIIANREHFVDYVLDAREHARSLGIPLFDFTNDQTAFEAWREAWFRAKAPQADAFGVLNKLVVEKAVYIAYLFNNHRDAVRFRLRHGGVVIRHTMDGSIDLAQELAGWSP